MTSAPSDGSGGRRRRVQGERWPALMTLATLAAYLDRSEATVEREVVTGILPDSVRFGSRRMWIRVLVDEALSKLDGSAPYDWRQDQPGLRDAADDALPMAPERRRKRADQFAAEGKVAEAYDVPTLAKHWGCGADTIYSLVKSGDLESFKLGGKLIRIRRTSVEAYERRRDGLSDQSV